MVVNELADAACDGFTVNISKSQVSHVVSHGKDVRYVTAASHSGQTSTDRGDSGEKSVRGAGFRRRWWGERGREFECEFS